MSVFKNSFSVGMPVVPSDNVNIPYPNIVKSGIVDGVSAGMLVDSTVNFVDIGIKVGDTVFSNTDVAYAYVTGVFNGYLNISDNSLFGTVLQGYQIYQGENNGCYIYIGQTSGGDAITVETIAGNTLDFLGVKEGEVLPIQVKKVLTGSTVGRLIALW
jgi:hypothetical protein